MALDPYSSAGHDGIVENSAYYGPFRDALDSAPQFGNKKN
jgi:delta-aminolevulinic acid dehydratase/porphobilinogen synthase